MLRKIKKAAIARTGNMNSATAAPRGRCCVSIPMLKAYVPKRCVVYRGPPWVKIHTISKFAKVTMVENITVMAINLLSMGNVTYRKR